ncbi:NAD dependent epimerase dehydratase family protein [Seminavis robusta]|uniref:NAD dependent epimerase dehydratase family protein n=1 Tax=Seminavis robusta TaxID=568900 RepID=A0A9N8H5A6_9STRA|nr:NAD dependent epimerase dehydratase family protein [Seminavis robusta]|eukprot:Sro69_g038700.1 NAD dependent epimerase dehydratase family protein (320) ;mRNA; r:119867-121067
MQVLGFLFAWLMVLNRPPLVAAFLGASQTTFDVCRTEDTAVRMSSSDTSTGSSRVTSKKGRLLVLGGTGFLGQAVCKRAALDGFLVTSLSRRGRPPSSGDQSPSSTNIKYLAGDAREKSTIAEILKEGSYTGIIHCVGLLLDEESGLGQYNRFASGSGSLPDSGSTYDTITRLTAFNAMDAAIEYAKENNNNEPFPFCFASAAEAGWPDMPGGSFVENNLAPDFLKRYLAAKRAVEERLQSSSSELLRPIIVRPSLIYTMDKPASLPAVGAFFIGNKIGLPFVDQPVTVQSLANAMVRSIAQKETRGILRFQEINAMSE